MAKGKAATPQAPESEAVSSLSAMRLRAYPTARQSRRLATWLSVSHGFRNEAVAWLSVRRRARGRWFAQHPGLSPEQIKAQLPPHLAGSDCTVLSQWLTHELEKARGFAVREFGLVAGKTQLGEAFATAWGWLSRGEKQEVRDRCRELGIHLDWLLVPRTVLDQVVRDLDRTCKKAIKDRAERKKQQAAGNSKKVKPKRVAGFPGFHKWSHAGSVRLQVEADKNTAFRDGWARKEAVIPGLGRIKLRESGYDWPMTPPKLITLARDPSGAWHVAFVCVEGQGLSARRRRLAAASTTWGKLPLDPSTGLPAMEAMDMSLPDLAVSNVHGKLGRTRHWKAYERRLCQANRRVSRRKKGSGRWKKACRVLGKVHTRVAHVRDSGLRQAAQTVADRSAIACVETLKLAFMCRNSRLAKSIHDLGWGTFVTYLDQAMAARGHLLLRAGQFDPTTQACSTPQCGFINRQLKNNLKLRIWDCPRCGRHHDRDENAANNIQDYAISRFMESSNGAESALELCRLGLHPELYQFLVRGGMTALVASSLADRRRTGRVGGGCAVPGKRELDPKPVEIRREQISTG